MLQYLNQGYRSFGAHPIAPHPRINWEFYAVLEGRCAPVIVNLPERPLVSRTLWVFPPWAVHGWRGEPGAECRVVCFHFAFMPAPLEEMFRNQDVVSCEITEEQCRRLSAMAHELRPHFEQPTRLTHLHFQRALFELALLAAGQMDQEPLPELAQSGNSKVERAIAWFFEHMADSPTIEEVALNIHVSPSHLRRLFMLIHKESPRLTFKRLRLQRALELLSETNAKLEEIATQCGYASASDFCRAFRSEFHVSPSAWRQNDYDAVPGAALRPDWLGRNSWVLHKPFAPMVKLGRGHDKPAAS